MPRVKIIGYQPLSGVRPPQGQTKNIRRKGNIDYELVLQRLHVRQCLAWSTCVSENLRGNDKVKESVLTLS